MMLFIEEFVCIGDGERSVYWDDMRGIIDLRRVEEWMRENLKAN